MDLTRPTALLLLGLIPLLWWLAIPPRPRRVMATAHLPLWEEALRRLRRESERFRPLRFWLLAGALAAAAIGAAGPILRGRPGPRVVAVLIDNSASMGAREADGTTALAAVQKGLREIVPTLPPGLTFRWGHTGPGAEPQVGRGDAVDLLAAVNVLEPVRESGFPLDRIASALQAEAPGMAVWLWTDARGLWNGPDGQGAVELVGSAELPNAAWTRVSVEDSWPLPEIRFEGEFVWSGGAARPDVTLVGSALEVVGVEIDEDTETDGLARCVLRAVRRSGGEIQLRFMRAGDGGGWEDAQPSDDGVTIAIAPPGASRIGIRDGGGGIPSVWGERAAGVLAELTGGMVVNASPEDRVDLLLLEGGLLDGPGARSLTFGTGFGSVGAVSTGVPPTVVDWNRRHPLTRGLDLSELRLRGRDLRPLPVGETLILGDDGPLAVAVEGSAGRSVHFAFELDESNLPYLAACPQILRRALIWTAGVETRPVEVQRASREEARLVRPSQATRRDLPQLATPDRSLVGLFLLLSLGLLAVRAHVR